MKIKSHIFPSLALVLAPLAGAQAVQAQTTQARITPLPTDQVLKILYSDTDLQLRQNPDLVISLNQSATLIVSSGASGPNAAQQREEIAAKLALDRAALPLIMNRLEPSPGSQLPEAIINPVFDRLVKYLTIHSRNMAIAAVGLDKVGLEKEAAILVIAADLQRGGTMAGLNLQYGGQARDKQNAVINYYTGMEASRIIQASGLDLRISRKGDTYLKYDLDKRTIDLPGMYLRQPEIMEGAGYAFREIARRIVADQKPKRRDTMELLQQFDRYGTVYYIDFKMGAARDVLLPAVAERLRAILPEPKPAPVAPKVTGKAKPVAQPKPK